jgi:starch-binding outer membrane protein, SusD/RagB family
MWGSDMRAHNMKTLPLLSALGALLLVVQACTKELLKVTDPDIIPDETLKASSASGALGLHNGAILRLAQATAGTQQPDALFVFGGLLTDEWQSGDTFIQRNTMDQRIWDPQNTFHAGPYRNLNRARVMSAAAIDALRQYKPAPATNIGRMFAFIAYVQTLIGEHYCNGTPISELQGSTVVPGNPISNDSMFVLAITHTDSAVANLSGGDSAAVANLNHVVRGRALLDRGQFAPAAAAVATVPDNFHYDVQYSIVAGDNQIWALNSSARRYTVGDVEGINGLNYRSANDPRIPTKRGPDRIFDTAFPLQVIRQGIWGRDTSVRIASGIEARLIEAEAALQAGDPTTWLAKLNQLRANAALLPAPVDTSYRPVAGTLLAPLADPGPSTGDTLRIKLMFRERAFWLFGTGHRLGDMRRLLRQYGRTEAQVYPIGAWFKGGNYGDAIQMPVPFDEQNNPNFVSCTNRNP